jgi:co-chaperonin GroES (HSP10)
LENKLSVELPHRTKSQVVKQISRFSVQMKRVDAICEKTLEEYLRWRVIAAGPGVYSSAGTICPNPLKVGDVVICMTWANQDIRERWDKVAELIHGQKCLAIRGFAPENYLVVVDHISSE